MSNPNELESIVRLSEPPTTDVLRLAAVRSEEDLDVDAEKGLIGNLSIITRGPAVGHGFDVDDVMLAQVSESINAHPNGVKVRVGHPMSFLGSEDGAWSLVGRILPDTRVEGDRVRGNLQLGPYAKSSPRGDLWSWLVDLATHAPEDVGLSIVFERGPFEERTDENGQSLAPFGRVKDVLAADFTDDPAANPGGLLSKPRPERTDVPDTKQGARTMDELKKFLQHLGLATDASDETAEAFREALGGNHRTIADRLANGEQVDWKTELGVGTPQTQLRSGGGGGNPQPTNTPANQPTGQNTGGDGGGQEQLAQTGTREAQIIGLAEQFGRDLDWVRTQMTSGRAVGAIKDAMLEELARQNQPVPTGGGRNIQVGEDRNLSSLGAAMSDALLLSSGVQLYEFTPTGGAVRDGEGRLQRRDPHERARQFQPLGLMNMARKYLSQVGLQGVIDMGDTQILELAMNPRRLAGVTGDMSFLAQGTADFPYILENTIRKSIQAMYHEMEPSVIWPLFCDRDTNPDYRSKSLVTVSEGPDLLSLDEHGEIRYARMREGKETLAVTRFARGLRFTKQMLKNDDKSVFSKWPRMLVTSARRKEDDLVVAYLVANGAMSDGDALFHSNHGNLAAGDNVGVPSSATLEACFVAMAQQTGLQTETDGDGGAAVLDIEPEVLLVPKTQHVRTNRLVSSERDIDDTDLENIWRSRFKVVSTARLDNVGVTKGWYAFAKPGGPAGGMVLGFLDGEEAPITKSEVEFDTEDLKVAVTHNLGTSASNHRGIYKNPGE